MVYPSNIWDSDVRYETAQNDPEVRQLMHDSKRRFVSSFTIVNKLHTSFNYMNIPLRYLGLSQTVLVKGCDRC